MCIYMIGKTKSRELLNSLELMGIWRLLTVISIFEYVWNLIIKSKMNVFCGSVKKTRVGI